MPISPPETHEDNANTAENLVRHCHVYATEEADPENAGKVISQVDTILTEVRNKLKTIVQASQELDALMAGNAKQYIQLETTNAELALAIEAIKNYKVD